MRIAYNLAIGLAIFILKIVALFNTRIRTFLSVRRGWEDDLSAWKMANTDNRPILCIHCASLGEYEMVVPLISDAAIAEKFNIVLTFFSPSGYKHAKLGKHVTGKFYLPLDTPGNMKRFVKQLNPSVFVFVKYELWYNLMRSLRLHGSQRILVNGLFRRNQFAMSFWGGFVVDELRRFNHLFVQDEDSKDMLESKACSGVQVTGDMRFDRVSQIKSNVKELPEVEQFCNGATVLIAGSSWPAEEAILLEYMRQLNSGKHPSLNASNVKLIIAPHDVGTDHVIQIANQFEFVGVSYYQGEKKPDARVLIINTIGVLSSAYRYADVAFIGGAFDKGLHNVLEAVTFGLPVITGPKTDKFPEAKLLEQIHALARVEDADEFQRVASEWMGSEEKRVEISRTCENWIDANTGATGQVVNFLIHSVQ